MRFFWLEDAVVSLLFAAIRSDRCGDICCDVARSVSTTTRFQVASLHHLNMQLTSTFDFINLRFANQFGFHIFFGFAQPQPVATSSVIAFPRTDTIK